MHAKFLLVVGAIFAPLIVAAPTGDSEDKAASAALKERKMDPLFEIMAWKEGLDQILQNAAKNKGKDHTNGDNNSGWSHPIWPYE